MVAALWSNSNWDDDKGTRKNAIDELEEKYRDALGTIYGPGAASEPEPQSEEIPELDKSNPFFAAVDRGMQKFDTKFGHVQDGDGNRSDDKHMAGLDQS